MDNKIFITLGSQKFQFNRLLKAVDELCEKGTVDAEDVFAQIGYSDYLPKNFSYKKFLDETSTGVHYDIEMISEFCKKNGIFLVVDQPVASSCHRA